MGKIINIWKKMTHSHANNAHMSEKERLIV